MYTYDNQQQCRKYWQMAKTITPSDLIALWCNQQPSEFNAFLTNTGYLPSCADAKKALLLEALEDGELDYIDDGLPYNGGLWIGGNITELLAKKRIRIEKDKAKAWIIYLHQKGNLGNLPNFLLDELDYQPNTQQQIADLQAQNTHLQARIAELETAILANDDTELMGASKKAVTKLLYALLLEHNYSIDGATNNTLENLTISHNVPISRQTIANWLAEVNNKNK